MIVFVLMVFDKRSLIAMSDLSPKIVIVTNLYPTARRPYFGTFVRNFHEDLVGRGWEADLFALPRFGSGIVGYIRFYLSVFLFLIRSSGLVYVHYVSHSALPVVIARLFNNRLKIVCHYHGSDAFPESNEGGLRCWAKSIICKAANKIASVLVVPTEMFKQRLIDAYKPNLPVFVSPSGGVDEAVFFSNEKNNDSLRVCFAGRMIPGKGALVAARLMNRLSSEVPGVKGVLIGDGDEREGVEAILQSASCDGIHILPPMGQPQLADEFRSSSIFLFPSTRTGESLGLTWVEAALCGALPLVMKNGVTESLIPEALIYELVAHDEEDLYKKLYDFSSDRSRRDAVVKQLREDLSLKYGKDKVGESLSNMLSKLSRGENCEVA